MNKILGVYFRPQTYLNALYLLVSFPLGIGYFVFLITGFSVGFGTLIIWIGLLILLLVLEASVLLIHFERILAALFLDVDIPSAVKASRLRSTGASLNDLGADERLAVSAWRRLKSQMSNPTTWTGIIYLFAKFPLGIASFVSVVVLVSVSASLSTLVIWYRWSDASIGSWEIDTFPEALIWLPVGLLGVLITPHILNLEAALSAQFARLMLSNHPSNVA